MKLFIYGSLLDREVLEYALGRKYDGSFRDATLRGYIKLQPGFFMIFHHEGAEVKGKVIDGLGSVDFIGLDDYEGVIHDLYRRGMHQVIINEGATTKMVSAWMYYNGLKFKKEDYMKQEATV